MIKKTRENQLFWEFFDSQKTFSQNQNFTNTRLPLTHILKSILTITFYQVSIPIPTKCNCMGCKVLPVSIPEANITFSFE